MSYEEDVIREIYEELYRKKVINDIIADGYGFFIKDEFVDLIDEDCLFI